LRIGFLGKSWLSYLHSEFAAALTTLADGVLGEEQSWIMAPRFSRICMPRASRRRK